MNHEIQDRSQTNLSEEGSLNIEKIFVKSISLESPHTPKIFLEVNQPKIDIKFNVHSSPLEENFYENVLTATVTTTAEDKRVIFLCEVAQSGIFRLDNINSQSIDIALHITCPSILFPYLREVVSETIIRAGFPPLYLTPINFEVMYQQQLKQMGHA